MAAVPAPTVEEVCTAIQTLNFNHDSDAKQRASEWLEHLQKTVHAWSISDQLLQRKISTEASYFAAQTMRSKILYSFHELPAETLPSLRESLLVQLRTFSTLNAGPVVIQLALAVADLAVYMQTWSHATRDMIMNFGSSADTVFSLLEFLSVLPEEVRNGTLRVPPSRRDLLRNELTEDAAGVYPLFIHCFEKFAQDTKVIQKVFKCLNSWLLFGGPGSLQFAQSGLLTASFQALSMPELSDSATNAIVSAVYLSAHLPEQQHLRSVIVPLIFQLKDLFQQSVATDNPELAYNIARIFAELGDSEVGQIAHNPQEAHTILIQLMVLCATHSDIRVARLTFNFWYNLADMSFPERPDGPGAVHWTPAEQERRSAMAPIYIQLAPILGQRLQMDDDQKGLLSKRSELHDFRFMALDLIKQTSFVPGSTALARHVFQYLKMQPSPSWQLVEAMLFLLSTLLPNIPAEDNEVVPHLFQDVLGINASAHLALRHTAVEVLGFCDQWLSLHPEGIAPALQAILGHIQTKELVAVSAASLQYICTECRDKIGEHFDVLLQVVGSATQLGMKEKDVENLLKGCGRVLVQFRPPARAKDAMQRLCGPMLHQLMTIVSNPADQTDPIVLLDRISIVFQSCNLTAEYMPPDGVHPLLEMATMVWQALDTAMKRYQASKRTIEHVNRCLKYLMRSLGIFIEPIYPSIVHNTVNLFQAYQHPSCLYIMSKCVDLFGGQLASVELIAQMMTTMCQTTFAVLAKSPDALREHPDVVEDFYRLCTRVLEFQPMLVIRSELTRPIIDCAVASLVLEHRDANDTVTFFLHSIMGCPRVYKGVVNGDVTEQNVTQAVVDILQTSGQAMVHNLVFAAAGGLPTFLVPDVSEVLFDMAYLNRDVVRHWAETSPSMQALPNHLVTAEDKQNFLDAFQIRNLRDFREQLKTFSRLFFR
eukprot:m.192901 g.192901  ORF g.192901 m.192901 type:complete len:935 (-) comp18277_c0_seq1:107-2911(-)